MAITDWEPRANLKKKKRDHRFMTYKALLAVGSLALTCKENAHEHSKVVTTAALPTIESVHCILKTQ